MEEEFVPTFLLQNVLIRQHLVFMLEGHMPDPHQEANMVAETDIVMTVVDVAVTVAPHPLTTAEDADHHRLAIVVAVHLPTAEEGPLHRTAVVEGPLHRTAVVEGLLHLMEEGDRHHRTADVALL